MCRNNKQALNPPLTEASVYGLRLRAGGPACAQFI